MTAAFQTETRMINGDLSLLAGHSMMGTVNVTLPSILCISRELAAVLSKCEALFVGSHKTIDVTLTARSEPASHSRGSSKSGTLIFPERVPSKGGPSEEVRSIFSVDGSGKCRRKITFILD